MTSLDQFSPEELLAALKRKGLRVSTETEASAKRVANRSAIEQNLLLYEVILSQFDCNNWHTLKSMFAVDDNSAIRRGLIRLSNGAFLTPSELESLIDSVEGYGREVQKTLPDFVFTDYQFFAVLFTEIFFTHQQDVRSTMQARLDEHKMLRLADISTLGNLDDDQLKDALANLLADEKNRTKAGGFTKAFDKRLDAFLDQRKNSKTLFRDLIYHEPASKPFRIADKQAYLSLLNRLAYYMATGSGKTHLLHINILQAHKHLPSTNMYLLAPTDALAKQHVEKLKAFRPGWKVGYIADTSDKVSNAVLSMCRGTYEMKVMTVHQLNAVLASKNNGFLNLFGDCNIVFADEGHKGTDSSNGWRNDRNKLMGNKGFCFEYSATFSQSIKNDVALIQDYAKAIIFDYPYRLFRQDEYGKLPAFYPQEKMGGIAKLISGDSKDKVEITQDERWPLFVEAMASFYEQKLFFQNKSSDPTYREHHFENPLMLLMAYSVESKDARASNVLEILGLLDRFCKNKNNESENTLTQILGKVGRWHYLDCTQSGQHLFNSIFDKVFHSKSPDVMKIWRISEKELGLRIAGQSKYFGTIFVGSADSIGLDIAGLSVQDDRLSDSLIDPFFGQAADNPDINIVIAARKLIEGWDTHRISTLGLFDLGKKEGSLIVQLFGRGVRLRGTNESKLKRTGKFPISERFNIFGFDAGFLQEFIVQSELEDTINQKAVTIAIQLNDGTSGTADLIANKQIPVCPVEFEDGECLTINSQGEVHKQAIKAVRRDFSGESMDSIEIDIQPFIDSRKLFTSIKRHGVWKRNIQWKYNDFNEVVKQIFNSDSPVTLKKAALPSTEVFHSIAESSVASYVRTYFNAHKKLYEFERAELRNLDVKSKNIGFEYYTVTGDSLVIERLENELISSGAIQEVKYEDREEVQTAFFERDKFALKIDKHLYAPLLSILQQHEGISISPDRLEPSEVLFMERFQQYTKLRGDIALSSLRNQKEIGFSSFYPDFVIWYEHNGLNHIAFVDPKGVTTGNASDVADKLLFSLEIKKIEARIRETSDNIRLHSYLLLNHLLEDYESNRVIKTVLSNILTTPFTGGIAPQLSSDDFIKLLKLFNAYSLKDVGVIEHILKDMETDSHEKQRNNFSQYLFNLIPDDSKNKIKEYCDDTSKLSLVELRSKYQLNVQLKTTDEFLYGLILRDILKDANGYNEFCKMASAHRNKDDAKEGFRAIAEHEAGELVTDIGMEMLVGAVPYGSLAWKLLKIAKRKYDEKQGV